MAAVNWDGTEKIIDQSCHTVIVTKTSYKLLMSFENNNIHRPKKTVCDILKIFNFLLQNAP